MITSLTNQKVKEWCKLHQKKYRDETGMFLVEEAHLIQEAIQANIVETIISTSQDVPFEWDIIEWVDQKVMNKISRHVSEVQHIALCHYPKIESSENKRALLLDDVQDPGNVGTMIRSAVSFGFDHIYLSKNCCDVYNEKCIRASQGAIFKIAIESVDLVSRMQGLKEEGFCVVGTSLQESICVETLKPQEKMAFVLGNEGQGVSKEVLNETTINVIIPIVNFESLNVGVAAGILCYLFKSN
ncbi:MAG: RNA methyltransferase [Erysipelotrichaceae bacterium]